jgi:hypothetical protein
MKQSSKSTIEVRGTDITVLNTPDGDFISLTDMLKAKDGDFFISDWLRNRNTIEFLGIWESVYNPDFNSGEFAIIKSQAGLNSYKVSVKEWVEKTGAVGLKASAGRYGGTYASEADLLNVALFGQTAKQWRDGNPDLDGNMRDHASIEQLLVLANLESLNAEFIHMRFSSAERLGKLNAVAIRQMSTLTASPTQLLESKDKP